MLPFLLSPKHSAVDLYRRKDDRFQLIRDGELGSFMSGFGYFLVEPELADYFKKLKVEKITIKDAIIWDSDTKETIAHYREVVIGQYFRDDQISDLNLDGDRILQMNSQYVFVSPSLMEKLHDSQFTYLRFSEGLEGFG